jgi:hypothetical protein
MYAPSYQNCTLRDCLLVRPLVFLLSLTPLFMAMTALPGRSAG